MMDSTFEMTILGASRAKLYRIMGELTTEQLFCVPAGFKNNVLWHVGHCVTSQQRLVYTRSGLPMCIPAAYADNFRIGTSPAGWASLPDPAEIRDSLLSTLEQLKQDIAQEKFTRYEPMRTGMGIMLENYVQALSYTNFHEAEHTGNLSYIIKVMQFGS